MKFFFTLVHLKITHYSASIYFVAKLGFLKCVPTVCTECIAIHYLYATPDYGYTAGNILKLEFMPFKVTFRQFRFRSSVLLNGNFDDAKLFSQSFHSYFGVNSL